MDNWNVDINLVDNSINNNELSANDIDDLLIKISWTKHPDIIKKLLAYKSSSNAPVRSKTDAELKAEWKTEKLKNGTLCLVQYKGSDTTVSVPEKIGKERVTEIGEYAFSPKQPRIKKEIKESRSKIQKIIIGNFIKKIGEMTFFGCENLQSVVFSGKIKSIPDGMFQECKKIKSIEIPDSVTSVGYRAFQDCESLEDLVLPEGLKKLNSAALRGCSALKRINLPDGLKDLVMACDDCTALEEVDLPKELKKIHGFVNCISLKSVTLPEGLEEIGQFAFSGCKKLKKIRIPSSVKKIDEYAFGKGIKLILPEDSPVLEFVEKNKFSFSIE